MATSLNNSISNKNTDSYSNRLDNLLLNLKIISNIKEFDKLSITNDNMFIDAPHIFQSIVRTWTGDSRTNTINTINAIMAGESNIPFSRILSSSLTSIISPIASFAKAFTLIINSSEMLLYIFFFS